MKVKLKMTWRLHIVGDSRNIECLPRKATGSKQSQSRREAMWAALAWI
jgi:hypothetical protein